MDNSCKSGRPLSGGDHHPKGMTLLELMIAVFIISTLAVIAYLGYQEFIYRSQVSQAVADICRIDMKLQRYIAENLAYPPTLGEIGENGRLDPWGNPYAYLAITGAKTQLAQLRKDKNLVPINTDFDLYSRGRDGNTVAALTAKASQDDIIRGNNGKFIGLASKY